MICMSGQRITVAHHTYDAHNYEELKELADHKPGFIRAMRCGCQECEEKLKEEVGITSRCMPFKQEKLSDTCVCCGKPATKMVYWGQSILKGCRGRMEPALCDAGFLVKSASRGQE